MIFASRIFRLREDLFGIAEMLPFNVPFVWSYLLVDQKGIVLIDAGVHQTWRAVIEFFRKTHRPVNDLKAILLTHGHSDHIHAVSKLRKWSGTQVCLSSADRAIADGTYHYRGVSRMGSFIEALSRVFLDCRPVKSSRPISHGDHLPFWGGLEVISLPGHTPGHAGFYSRSKRILFCGDSLLCWNGKVVFPHPFFNTDHQQVRESVLKLVDYPADWVYPMHHIGLNHNIMMDIEKYAASRRQPAGEVSS